MNADDNDPNEGGHPASELDDVFSAADERLLDVLRHGLDLGAGLAEILGHPPRREVSLAGSAVPAPVSAVACGQSTVSSRIAALRFDILDLQRHGEGAFSDTSAALLLGAASSLKDLHRGLEARELTRFDAVSLLDQVNLSLEKALDTQQQSFPVANRFAPPPAGRRQRGRHREKKSSWLRWMLSAPTWVVCLSVMIPVLAAAGSVFAVAPLIHSADAVIGAVVVPGTVGLVFMTTLIAGPVAAAWFLHRRAARLIELRYAEIEMARSRSARGDSRAHADGDPNSGRAAGQARQARRSRTAQFACELMYLNAPGLPGEPPQGGAVMSLRALRVKLDQVRPDVVRLFDEDDRSSRCTPHA